MSEERIFNVSMKRISEFKFEVDFGIDGVSLIMDEPHPVGNNTGPNASKILAAAIGNCLTASLLFCLQKARVEVGEINTRVSGLLRRNQNGRWRISQINVDITPMVVEEFNKQFDRCNELFEDFCIVSKSIEQGIPIKVKVHR
jgi:organic hydroperoxide reductase OsmC/OhrA